MCYKNVLYFIIPLISVMNIFAQDEIQGPPPFWKIKGNIGTDSTLHFIGTTDAIPFRIYTNNTERGRIQYNTGNFGWNTTTPASKLDINGDIALREGTAIACVAGNNAITLAGENSFYRLTGAAGAFAINTITGGNDGQLLFLINDAGQTLTVNNNNAANGILTGTGANLIGVGTTNQSVLLIYNATLARWVVTSSSGFYDKNDWHTKGNTDTEINSPLPPATYGTSTIAVTENWIGTQSTADDFVIGTANKERARFLGNDGKLGIGTATPSANFLMTVNPTTNALRSGIDIPMLGASSTAYGINIIASNQQMNGLRYENTGTGLSNSFSGVAAVLSGARNVSGYLAYRTNTGKTYGVFGITGTNASYAQADSVWAGNYKGRVHIGLNDPVTPLVNNIDLEIRNTTTNQPSTTLLRQTSSNATAGTVLANLNFGDNYTSNPQAQIQVIRDVAGGSTADLPTAITFSTTPNASSTLTERVRINNGGAIAFNGAANTGTNGQILISTGANTPPIWQNRSSIITTYTSGTAARTIISVTQPTYTDVTNLVVDVTITGPATVYLFTTGNLETFSSSSGGSGCIVRLVRNTPAVPATFTPITNGVQVVDINDAVGVTGTIGIWSMALTESLTNATYPATFRYKIQAAKYGFDSFYAGGNSTAPAGYQNNGSLIAQVFY